MTSTDRKIITGGEGFVRLFLACLALTLAGSAASAASPEAAYIAARDRALAKIDDFQGDGAGLATLDVRLMHELGKRLTPIIGDPAIKGFASPGRLNAEFLVEGNAGGVGLDGLVYVSLDDKAQVVVSTVGLTKRMMLADTRLDMNLRRWMPATIAAAFRSEEFYLSALGKDSVSDGSLFALFGELPAPKPAKTDILVAMLVAHSSQPWLIGPNEVLVAVVQAGKVKVATAPLAEAAAPIAACQAIQVEADAEQKATNAAVEATNNVAVGHKLRVAGNQSYDAALAAHAKCVVDAVPHQPYYAAAIEQARALADRLIAK